MKCIHFVFLMALVKLTTCGVSLERIPVVNKNTKQIKERKLADSQAMLDAQDTRKILIFRKN